VDRKRFSIAIHYREVIDRDVATIKHIVGKVHHSYPRLRIIAGKSIIELQPDIDWNKGKALLWLQHSVGMSPERSLSIYIGDDLTDEDAFHVLGSEGIGILVTASNRKTLAQYRLTDIREVKLFLNRLLTLLSRAVS
jgi:trehalose-phosphatase